MTSDVLTLRREVRELTNHWRSQGHYIPRSDNWLRGFDPAFSKELSRRGLIGLTWPTEYGGAGLPNVVRFAVTEELLRAGAPVAAHWVADRQIGPAILRHGSEQLRREILPGIESADFMFCLGMSEPEAGSDLASVRTSATAVDGGWRLRGHKIWTQRSRTTLPTPTCWREPNATERKHDGLTEFIVDMDRLGISVSPILDLTDEHHFNEMVFDDVFVPRRRVLGLPGHGWRQVVEQLSFERGGPERVLSSYPLLADLLDAADDLDADVLVKLGELTARLAALRRLSWQVAASIDAGVVPIQQAATLKYLGNAFEVEVIEVARAVFPRAGRTARSATPCSARPATPSAGEPPRCCCPLSRARRYPDEQP